jgi:hypothetical protein
MPAVAGRFYPGSRGALLADLDRYTAVAPEGLAARGVVAPHAGYMYSGAVAGAVYGAVELPGRLVILCPNHTGVGGALAMMGSGAWRTPLGDAPVDAELAAALARHLPDISDDESAHRFEHSLEVQLPFVQFRRPEVRFVPVCVGPVNLGLLLRLGDALAAVAAEAGEPVLLVASSDMTHYESARDARRKDTLAVERMEALDPEGLAAVVRRESISMCGWAPAVAVMQACRKLGATRGQLVRYATSGDVTGDQSSVVGYAGVAFI